MSEIKLRKFGCVITASSLHCILMKSSVMMYIALEGVLESSLSSISMCHRAEAGFKLGVRMPSFICIMPMALGYFQRLPQLPAKSSVTIDYEDFN